MSVLNFLNNTGRNVGNTYTRNKKKVVKTVDKVPVLGFLERKLHLIDNAENLVNPAVMMKNVAVPMAQGLARVPETVARSGLDVAAKTAKNIKGIERASNLDKFMANDPQGAKVDPVRKALYGTDRVKTYQQRGEGYDKSLEEGTYLGAGSIGGKGVAKKYSNQLAFLGAGLTILGDLTIGGGSSDDVAKAGLKQLAKAETDDAVRAILSANKVSPDIIEATAKTIAAEKDVNVIKNTLTNAAKVAEESRAAKTAADVSPTTVAPQVGKTVETAAGTPIKPPTPTRKVVEAQNKVIENYGDYLRDIEKSATGGELVKNVDGTYYRSSGHSRFYRDYYASYGRAPSKQAYREYAAEQFRIGRADSYFQDAWNNLSGISDLRRRNTFKTIEETPNLPEETKAIANELDQLYGVKMDATKVDNAMTNLGTDRQGVIDRISTSNMLNDEDVAAGWVLLKDKNLDENVRRTLIEKLASAGTEGGRSVRAFGDVDRLSPEGVLVRLQREIRKRTPKEKTALENPTKQEIKGIVEAVPDTTTIDDALKEVSSLPRSSTGRRAAKELSPEEATAKKVAGNVERAASPAKKKADVLVSEITKKVKAEYLEPQVAVKRSPTDILREVFGRNQEAQDAYPMAQEILYNKYADNPEMMDALTKFFESELGLPASSSTINSAIAEQLAKNGVKIRDVVQKSWREQGDTVENITKNLVSEGFDEQSAKTLAKEVASRINQRMVESKKSILTQMAREVKPSQQKTFLEKIDKLSNVGALDDQDYLDLVRTKLDIPYLTSDQSSQLSALAQQRQAIADGAERAAISREMQKIIDKAIPKTTTEKIAGVFGIPRGIMASTDFSMGGRQGLLVAARHPKMWAEANAESLKFARSQTYYDDSMATIRSAGSYDGAVKSGLDLPAAQMAHEEVFTATQHLTGDTARKFGVGQVVGASERAYEGGLTKLRFDLWDRHIQSMGGYEAAKAAVGEKGLQGLAEAINTLTGRGGKAGGFVDTYAKSLSTTLFSPRLWASRLNVFNPKYWNRIGPLGRKEAVQSMGTFAALAGTVLVAAVEAGADVETDARSSDFLKIKVGDTRYDILGGFQQNIVFAWRQISGEKKNSMTGAITELGKPLGPSRLSITGDLVGNKLNPVLSTAGRLIEGKDKAGNKINPATEIANLFIPLSIKGTYDSTARAVKEGTNPLAGAAKSLPGYGGIGTQTYGINDTKISDTNQKYVDYLKSKGASPEKIKAVETYFKYKKNVPDKTAAYQKIDEALLKGDMKLATQLSADYNKAYKEFFKDWKAKYGDYASDVKLKKDYSSGRIVLTRGIMRTRIKNIKRKNGEIA